ncbi:hypothetical protein [Flavilitoribacter nigricans]|uniref:Thioredoxin domain-containing protein n=1 Tax=Flavilitoribacter nigricans (strain ATCC 23147 / DSM 23189 / NBRC 102662 / NCIMB 1420 / SS-2) TaxID=1122177 RepID=A0A2D0NGT8_FLAN2|nr:hypothetical protein [Flavilitoribacter nigricans]PHN07705.1 hypothetical protein CRP01_06285 [Flavilitoribacter nigricans DSM 23189 = NBRC 102662]
MQRILLILAFAGLSLSSTIYAQSVVRINANEYPYPFIFVSQSKYNADIAAGNQTDSLLWIGDTLTVQLPEMEEPLELRLSFQTEIGRKVVPLIVFPGDTIGVEIDVNRSLPASDLIYSEISGPNAAGHQFLYAHEYFPPIYYMDRMNAFLPKTSKDRLFEELQREFTRQLQPVDQLLAAGKIDTGYYDLVRGYVETPLLSNAVSQLYGKSYTEFEQLSIEDRQHLAEAVFAAYPPLEEKRLYGKQGSLYAINYFSFQRALAIGSDHFFGMPNDTVTVRGKSYILQDAFPGIYQIEDGSLREHLFAQMLYTYYQILQGDNQWLDGQTDFFFRLYPRSKYRRAIQWSQENSANKKRPERRMAATGVKVKSRVRSDEADLWQPVILDETWDLSLLKESSQNVVGGKNLYITIWSSGCESCREDFAFQDQTEKLLDRFRVERLYISVDDPENEEAWFQQLFERRLGGYHLRASAALKKELAAALGLGELSMEYPHYLMVSKGKIVEKNAARPGDFEALQEQVFQNFGY